ncbi:hypothetical protein [Pontibacter diazotrophicus]|uniref:hypothetical protein n=1 Tax=Pontibacter diazotrophicus TaxID=1400979 RepID=UPI0015F1B110|nr:hypothetical protein [Pontibacter diazotrophicus]
MVVRLHCAPALVVPEHRTLPDELLLLLVELVLPSVSVVKELEVAALGFPVPGRHTLQAVNPSACACATVVSIELFR